MTDEQLVAQIVSGQASEYRDIIARYQQPLLRYAQYLIHDADTADDVVQEAFIKAYQNLRSFRPDGKFSSWIYRIVHNCAMDSVKHTHVSIDDIPSANEPVAQNLDIDKLVDQTIAAKDAAACLAQLPIKYREPIALYFLEDRSYSEISDILHISVSAVGVHINRAKKQLRQLCADRGVQK